MTFVKKKLPFTSGKGVFIRTKQQVQLLLQLLFAYEQFLSQQFHCVVHRTAQYVAYGEEHRCVVVDDAAAGGDGNFAIGKGVEGIDGFVR